MARSVSMLAQCPGRGGDHSGTVGEGQLGMMGAVVMGNSAYSPPPLPVCFRFAPISPALSSCHATTLSIFLVEFLSKGFQRGFWIDLFPVSKSLRESPRGVCTAAHGNRLYCAPSIPLPCTRLAPTIARASPPALGFRVQVRAPVSARPLLSLPLAVHAPVWACL